MDLFLPFSLCSSPVLFNEYASAPENIMFINHIPEILDYLDDYFSTSPPYSPQYQHNVDAVVQTCVDLILAVNAKVITRSHNHKLPWDRH